MKLKYSSLREFVSIVLREEAVSVKQARKDSLAMRVSSKGPVCTYMLYDINGLIDLLMNSKPGKVYSFPEMAKFVYGFISVNRGSDNPYTAAEVRLSAAVDGYGPLMHDIAMSEEGKIFADRSSVSPEEKKVWNFYRKNRSDVRSHLIDDITDTKTPPTYDDGFVWPGDEKNSLNFVYSKSHPTNFKTLVNNHESNLPSLRKAWRRLYGDPLTSKDFDHLGQAFFETKYL